MAAQRDPDAWIDAVEIDDASAQQAAENASKSPWADRVRVHRMDVRRMRASEPYDLILCNPPFYAGEMDSPDAHGRGQAQQEAHLRTTSVSDAARRGRPLRLHHPVEPRS